MSEYVCVYYRLVCYVKNIIYSSIYPFQFSVRYGKKRFFSILGKRFDSVVQLSLYFY